jgi:hypothetical protein
VFKSQRGHLVEGSHRGRASAPSVPSERDRTLPSKPTQALSWTSLRTTSLPLSNGGMGVHLNHPITAQRGIRNSRPARWGLWKPHPPSRGETARERTKQVEELAPTASNGPRLRGSTHGYTSWGAPNADNAKYARVAPPRPAEISPMPTETNTLHTGRSFEKNLAEAPTLLQGFGG